MKTVSDFIFEVSKINEDGNCIHGIKRGLLLWKESYDQPRQHIKNQRRYFANKGPYSQSYSFPVVMYGCESWTIELSAKELMLLNCGIGEDS